MKFTFLSCLLLLLLFSCNRGEIPLEIVEDPLPYTVSGRVTDLIGIGIEGVQVLYSPTEFVLSDDQGYWAIADLYGEHTLSLMAEGYTFLPLAVQVDRSRENLFFKGTPVAREHETKIYTWLSEQQLANGLVEGAENGNVVSLYDNALASMVFMLKGDFTKAEKIFDFFNGRISTELTSGVGGFSQLRDGNGRPNNHRWMGDNAWLLIALNHYKALTSSTRYDNLAKELRDWLLSLQDADGGLFAGYAADNSLMNYKVTEGNIDAFNAIDGYTDFHRHLLDFLENDRWDAADKSLVAWPTNPKYLYALDLHAWSYAIFEDYPIATLTAAERFVTTKTATNGAQITGYCFDEDKDTVWPEGTGQMALAFGIAGMSTERDFYLKEMEKILLQSPSHANAAGFPYASNPGTTYGADVLWTGADTKIAPSGGAWYIFAKSNFNPFAVGRNKEIPVADMFWVD
ncbi:MAG: carboxypeptidase-like regulatory domain-containing protein [Bacteroidia bacterium]|nr:carboxypeptidase-like regulatory domain-containing protein [Bacteroidia bacterium]